MIKYYSTTIDRNASWLLHLLNRVNRELCTQLWKRGGRLAENERWSLPLPDRLSLSL